nr:hypothetical protein [Tanacetum cinerariifolium]
MGDHHHKPNITTVRLWWLLWPLPTRSPPQWWRQMAEHSAAPLGVAPPQPDSTWCGCGGCTIPTTAAAAAGKAVTVTVVSMLTGDEIGIRGVFLGFAVNAHRKSFSGGGGDGRRLAGNNGGEEPHRGGGGYSANHSRTTAAAAAGKAAAMAAVAASVVVLVVSSGEPAEERKRSGVGGGVVVPATVRQRRWQWGCWQ